MDEVDEKVSDLMLKSNQLFLLANYCGTLKLMRRMLAEGKKERITSIIRVVHDMRYYNTVYSGSDGLKNKIFSWLHSSLEDADPILIHSQFDQLKTDITKEISSLKPCRGKMVKKRLNFDIYILGRSFSKDVSFKQEILLRKPTLNSLHSWLSSFLPTIERIEVSDNLSLVKVFTTN